MPWTSGDGNVPDGLIADVANNLFGVTELGGAHGEGTVFRVAPDGSETVLYSFSGLLDGEQCMALRQHGLMSRVIVILGRLVVLRCLAVKSRRLLVMRCSSIEMYFFTLLRIHGRSSWSGCASVVTGCGTFV